MVSNNSRADDGTEADEASRMRYAGFWSRLLANLVDMLALAPVMAIDWWTSSSKTMSLVLLIPLSVAGPIYSVSMHARWGQTLGKMVARIRVTTLSGGRISWREAILREGVTIAFNGIATVSTMLAMLRLPESAWGRGVSEMNTQLGSAQPIWGEWATLATTIWFWGELLVLLFNKKRRALHDFIAGTVVVRLG